MNAAYYNEIDPCAAQWLRNLIAARHLPAGDVDERSIELVRSDDLRPYSACHFFAGIGGWPYALRLAGWSDARPVWTGSCPCQPFSAAGKGQAADDERHLWPAWFSLIRECRPARIFGEQVEAAIGWGWLDAVFADLEAEGYACASAILPACSVGAPHIRQRLWFVADAMHAERRPFNRSITDVGNGHNTGRSQACGDAGTRREICELADAVPAGWSEGWPLAGRGSVAGGGSIGELADAESQHDRSRNTGAGWRAKSADGSELGDADQPGSQGRRIDASEHAGQCAAGTASPWHDLVWLPCSDGKARPTQPGLFPLASGISGRVGRLRAYGNAIVPQVAAEFIRSAG